MGQFIFGLSIKIEDTHQEEKFHEVEPSQAKTATPISDEVTQKLFKAMEEQSDTVKKMGSHLTRLEEAKLKKTTACVELLDDE